MNKNPFFIFFFLILCMTPSLTQAFNSQNHIERIVIMRHAEKPFDGKGQLNCQGLNRALMLPAVLLKNFGKPDFIFAPDPSKKVIDLSGLEYYVRPLATIEPTAIFLNQMVNIQFGFMETDQLAKELLTPTYHDAVIFIAWEHIYSYFLAKEIFRQLHANADIPFWPGKDFDSLFVITIDWNQPQNAQFSHQKQQLDNQNKNCPESTKMDHPNNFIKYIFVPSAEEYEDLPQLTCQGLNRSLALARYFKSEFEKIDAFILPRTNLIKNHKRDTSVYINAIMTIEPTVIAYDMPFENYLDETKSFIEQLNDLGKDKDVIVIAWPFATLGKLARTFFASHQGDPSIIPDPVPNRDTIYEITIVRDDWYGIYFMQKNQNLNHQSKWCAHEQI